MFRTLLPVLAFLPAAAFAQGNETDVTFLSGGQEVIGTLALPEGEPAPVVLLLHGFTGTRDELASDAVPGGVFGHAAAVLAEAGYASLRIDFRGSGESLADLTFADTTFEGQVQDALAAIDYLRTLDSVATDDLYLVGWSQGGLVATATAGRSQAFDAVALWAAVADPAVTYGGILGPEAMDAAAAAAPGEEVEVTLPWAAITMRREFFDGIAIFDPQAEIAAYAGPLFVAQGTLDDTVAPASAQLLIDAHEGPEELWMAEMDHVFNAFATVETLDEMLDRTIAFFDAHAD
ncbi:alpha/beta hydrolase family protein [Wenxinia marina]|uniref:Alpha/beta hydrolase family n=1 Tax=Wenxinia marina DSM 24838 TaxID=1123501 RepID=A0A0D0NND4_9RHOB|nr:alpha/beta fold hydrolase [Wenxinia marina]KIQ69745.1 Alpha/beta hydrolase family [Wenxinia marina DSM 24838]GGL60835.1 alpha/beta hydrolase [Wenxinia marina]